MITNNIEPILDEMELIYQWSPRTKTTYKVALNSYTQYQGYGMYELIAEAETDEETINKKNKRRIKQRLINYQIHLQTEKQATPNTTRLYISMISKVYKHFEIEIPDLPPIRIKQTETYQDIPTHQEISNAILHSRLKMKAVITFIASSGLRRSDVSQLTIQDFIQATTKYHQKTELIKAIQAMKNNDCIIPTWNLTDQKTGVTHITFNSHESSLYIIQMLKERILKKEVKPTDPLFELKPDTISKNFRNLNTKLGMGWKETRRYFHPHALRKYFATVLTSNDMDFLATEFLLGHTLSKVQSSYYFVNPDKLQDKYKSIMGNVTFTMEVAYVDINSKEKQELEELRRFKAESNERIRKLEELINIL